MVYSGSQRGFTFIEILVAIAIVAILGAASAATYKNVSESSSLKMAGSEVYTALTSAREKTLGGENDTVYGVHVSTTTITQFVGPTYVAGAATNRVYTFVGGITATSSLITSGTDVVFKRLTGEAQQGGTIYVRNSAGTSTTTIVVHDSGLVEYE